MRWLLLLCLFLWATSAPAVESVWGRGIGDIFYGIPSGNSANAYVKTYHFDLALPHLYDQLDRSNMTDPPTNWETDTGAYVANQVDSYWRTRINGTPSGIAELGNVEITNDEAGNYGLDFSSDTVDNVALNVNEFGPFRWLTQGAGGRSYAIEFLWGTIDLDGYDIFLGVCGNGMEVLDTDGTINAASYVGFHFLRSDGNAYPILAKSGGVGAGVVTLPFPTLREVDAGGQPNPDPVGPTGYMRYAIKGKSQSEWEFYINDQLVGYAPHGSTDVFIEMGICIGFVTNGMAATDGLFLDRITVVNEDND